MLIKKSPIYYVLEFNKKKNLKNIYWLYIFNVPRELLEQTQPAEVLHALLVNQRVTILKLSCVFILV